MGELPLRDEPIGHPGIHAVEPDDDESLVGLCRDGSIGGGGEEQGGQENCRAQDPRRTAFLRIGSGS